MRKVSSKSILVLSVLVSTTAALFFGLRSTKLQSELKTTEAARIQIEKRMEIQEQLRDIDSVLLTGGYQEALNAYEAKSTEAEISEDASIEMRVALAKELLRLRYENQMAMLQAAQSSDNDSVQVPQDLAFRAQSSADSLGFALEKARVELQHLRRQLAQKSFGEYLTFTNNKGSRMHYVGQVKHGKANGYGVALLNTGSRYVGEWKDNQRHGEGTYYWSDGEYYKGTFRDDKRNGEGTYYWPNGEKYVGHWEDNQRSGEGVFYGKDGKVIADGVWKDDKLAVLDDKRDSERDGR